MDDWWQRLREWNALLKAGRFSDASDYINAWHTAASLNRCSPFRVLDKSKNETNPDGALCSRVVRTSFGETREYYR